MVCFTFKMDLAETWGMFMVFPPPTQRRTELPLLVWVWTPNPLCWTQNRRQEEEIWFGRCLFHAQKLERICWSSPYAFSFFRWNIVIQLCIFPRISVQAWLPTRTVPCKIGDTCVMGLEHWVGCFWPGRSWWVFHFPEQISLGQSVIRQVFCTWVSSKLYEVQNTKHLPL